MVTTSRQLVSTLLPVWSKCNFRQGLLRKSQAPPDASSATSIHSWAPMYMVTNSPASFMLVSKRDATTPTPIKAV